MNGPAVSFLRNRVRDQRRLLISFGQCPPQLLVDFLSTEVSRPHLSIRNYCLSRVLAARGIDLTRRGMGAVEEDLQFDEEGPRQQCARRNFEFYAANEPKPKSGEAGASSATGSCKRSSTPALAVT